MDFSSGEEDAKNSADSDEASEPETRRLEGVKLVFAREAADLLPIVVR